jgi:hypothetical protein
MNQEEDLQNPCGPHYANDDYKPEKIGPMETVS